jgi:hypothetical protein
MSRRFALWSLRLAAATLPPARRAWGQAMRVELDQVGGGRDALAFALGCLAAAAAERVRSTSGRDGARLVFAILTAGLAAFHLDCAADGVRILAGGADPFRQSLLQSGLAATAEQWRAATPLFTLGFAALGLAELAIAVLAVRAERTAFVGALGAAVATALFQGATVAAVLGYTAGLGLFGAVVGLQAACSLLLWRFAMATPNLGRL